MAKNIFTVTTLLCTVFIFMKLHKHGFTDMGIIQKKVVCLLVLLFFFNEPFVSVRIIANLRFYALV